MNCPRGSVESQGKEEREMTGPCRWSVPGLGMRLEWTMEDKKESEDSLPDSLAC